MGNAPIQFSEDERNLLADLLESIRKETLIEEHRTDSYAYREQVKHRIELLTGIQQKLEGSAATVP